MTDLARTWADSYRTRLAIGYLLVVALFGAAWAWSLFAPLTNAVVDQHTDNLTAVAQAGALVLSDTTATPAQTVDRLVARTNLRMTIVASNGAVLADSQEDPAAMENHANRPEIAVALAGDVGTDRRTSATQGIEQIYVAVPASYAGRKVALRVSESLEQVNAVASSSRRTGLLLLGVALVIAVVIAARMTAIASEPVRRLTEAAQSMARGSLATNIPEESGDLRILSSALSDLRTQMKRRLEDLESEQRTQRAVLDGLTDSVFLLHGTEIRFANSAASNLFRAPAVGWRGRDIADVGLPASVVSAARPAADGSAHACECGPDPTGRILRVTSLPLDRADESELSLLVVSDVTERMSLDRMRRDFVANASHELKTPTAAIHLLAESAMDAAEDGDTAQAIEFARQIASESSRLARLVHDLLDLSRLETVPAAGTVVDVREAVHNALVGHRVAAAHRRLDITFDQEAIAGTDVYAAADPTDLAVALDNLLDNAIKYTERGGVRIAVTTDDANVRIAVTDTGIGIPAEDLPRVFERFYRVDRARSRDSGGTGLGLSLVRHVIERSNGTLDVASRPGDGSTFTIVLPRAR